VKIPNFSAYKEQEMPMPPPQMIPENKVRRPSQPVSHYEPERYSPPPPPPADNKIDDEGFIGVENLPPPMVQNEHKFIDKVKVLFDYEPDQDDELPLNENEILYVIRKNDDGWWEGVKPGSTTSGLFPGNYVESIK